jgi:hypothetical protein
MMPHIVFLQHHSKDLAQQENFVPYMTRLKVWHIHMYRYFHNGLIYLLL